MFLRYEDMLADPTTYVKKIADFAGIETTPEIIEKVGVIVSVVRATYLGTHVRRARRRAPSIFRFPHGMFAPFPRFCCRFWTDSLHFGTPRLGTAASVVVLSYPGRAS